MEKNQNEEVIESLIELAPKFVSKLTDEEKESNGNRYHFRGLERLLWCAKNHLPFNEIG